MKAKNAKVGVEVIVKDDADLEVVGISGYDLHGARGVIARVDVNDESLNVLVNLIDCNLLTGWFDYNMLKLANKKGKK